MARCRKFHIPIEPREISSEVGFRHVSQDAFLCPCQNTISRKCPARDEKCASKFTLVVKCLAPRTQLHAKHFNRHTRRTLRSDRKVCAKALKIIRKEFQGKTLFDVAPVASVLRRRTARDVIRFWPSIHLAIMRTQPLDPKARIDDEASPIH